MCLFPLRRWVRLVRFCFRALMMSLLNRSPFLSPESVKSSVFEVKEA